jgi:hypothetical protein
MKKFEYTVVRQPKTNWFISTEKGVEQFTTELNELGAQGWELIELLRDYFNSGQISYFFKRERD